MYRRHSGDNGYCFLGIHLDLMWQKGTLELSQKKTKNKKQKTHSIIKFYRFVNIKYIVVVVGYPGFYKVLWPEHDESWKVIPYYFHGKYGGLDFQLCCNYDKYFIDKICLPYLYKFVLLHFVEIKTSYNTQFCWFVLFNNKDILIGGRPIFKGAGWIKISFLLRIS